MDGRNAIRWFTAAMLSGLLPACSAPVAVDDLPAPRDTLTAVGKRLSRSKSVGELTTLARRGDRVLAALDRSERDALGRGYLRFRVDRPVVVDVAAPSESVPFWLHDQGFQRTALVLEAGGIGWAVFRKTFEAGSVGLGVNGLDRKARAHYAVFLRPTGGGPIIPREIDGKNWRVVSAGDAVSLAFDASFPVRRMPDELRAAVLLQAAHDRRHSTMLAGGRVWKTHVPSGRTPDQVAIAFGGDAAGSLVWTWRTEPGVVASFVRLAAVPSDKTGRNAAQPPRIVRGDSRLLETTDLLNDPVVRRHRVAVTGLAPGTLYAYELGDGSPGGWSPRRTVRTAPARSDRYSLLYLGDAQNGLEAWGRLLECARRRKPDAGVILLAGDLVDRGNERSNWDHFFLRAAGVLDGVALMPCAGNHEYLDRGPRLYRAFFQLPGNGPSGVDRGLVYCFEYADAFVAVLDSTLGVSSPGAARVQAQWLDGALARTRAEWKFVMFHHPVYASHPSRESPALRDEWVPVVDKHGVDLVLQGHDHAYLRTYPMAGGRRTASPGRGTVYVVSVSGDKFYDQDPRDYTAVGHTHLSTYQTIDIDVPENSLTFTAWDGQGREVDRFVIRKPGRERGVVAARGDSPAASGRRP
jgi:hypothetical protein